MEAEAISISIHRLSMHLGLVRPTSRPGSVSAILQSLSSQKSDPERGSRVSIIGLEIGVGTRWAPGLEKRQRGMPNYVKVAFIYLLYSAKICVIHLYKDFVSQTQVPALSSIIFLSLSICSTSIIVVALT